MPGNSWFEWNFHRKPRSPLNSGKFILGTPIWCFGGDFLREMRMAKVDMLGRSEEIKPVRAIDGASQAL